MIIKPYDVNKMIRKSICKVVVGGEGAVGKTTLCQRLVGTFEREKERLMTIGVDFHSLKIKNGHLFEAQIWDLGGQEQFRPFQHTFFRNSEIVILVFSVEWYETMICTDYWLDMLNGEKPLKVYLIANKIDSNNRFITTEEAYDFAKQRNMAYFELSALNGFGIQDLKEDIIETIRAANNAKDSIDDFQLESS